MRTLFVLLAVVGLSFLYIPLHVDIYTFISTFIMYIELDILMIVYFNVD